MIENGDELIVAGKLKFGKLEAWAFRNLRNGTSGHWDYNINQFATLAVIFMIVLAVACIIPVFLILPLLFIPYAVIAVLNRLRIAKEYRAIMTEPAEENSERAN